jgi:DegV family protein with EDD domain
MEDKQMVEVLVMTDSVACIPADLAKKYNIKIVPAANIFYEDKQYIDGVTISASDAYQLIKKDPDKFLTSAITAGFLLEKLRDFSKESNNILFISLSSALSAVSKTAGIAAELLKEELPQMRVEILDAKTVASGQGLIVIEAAKAAQKGMKIDKVTKVAEATRDQTKSLMILDTLRYVYRTGRMSKIGSRIASLFNIKPINQVTDEGKIEMVDRTRNFEHGLERMIEIIKESGGTEGFHFMVSHADAPEAADKFVKMLKDEFKCLSMAVSDYSPVMGYGAGPGAVFVGYHPEIDWSKS